jgi:hypothetical protein
VDLTELEWAEYDERSGLSTLISGSSPALFFLLVGLFLPVLRTSKGFSADPDPGF